MSAGQLTFNDVMKMFRDELLDLNEILNYIKLAPDDSAAATSVVGFSGGIPLCLHTLQIADQNFPLASGVHQRCC